MTHDLFPPTARDNEVFWQEAPPKSIGKSDPASSARTESGLRRGRGGGPKSKVQSLANAERGMRNAEWKRQRTEARPVRFAQGDRAQRRSKV